MRAWGERYFVGDLVIVACSIWVSEPTCGVCERRGRDNIISFLQSEDDYDAHSLPQHVDPAKVSRISAVHDVVVQLRTHETIARSQSLCEELAQHAS